MATWRIAKSLEKLRLQLNTLAPNRSKASDGGIGDAAHASRNSDHNPWVKDAKGVGVVTARDFTHDPAGGLDCHRLAEILAESRDPRIKYIIWNRRILSASKAPWKWLPYDGANAHTKHLHLSVRDKAQFYDSEAAWDLNGLSSKIKKTAHVTKEKRTETVDVDPSKVEEVESALTQQEQGPAVVIEADKPAIAIALPDAPPPLPSDTPVEVQKERTSIWSKIGALITLITGVGINLWGVIENKLNDLTPLHFLIVVGGLLLIAGALWFYDRSQQRAHEKTTIKMKAAADPAANNVELKR